MSSANNRFDKAVKTAMTSSAEKQGLPNHKSPSSSAKVPSSTKASTKAATKTATATNHITTAHTTASAAESPKASHAVIEKPPHVFRPHQTGDPVASADGQRFNKTASRAQATPQMQTRDERIKSRFIRA